VCSSDLSYYEEMGGVPRMGDGQRIPILHPGDKFSFTTSTAGPSGYSDFIAVFLRRMAGALGVTYAQISEDFGGMNFSSARAAMNNIWKDVVVERSDLAADIATPLYYAISEEGLRWGYWSEPAGAPTFAEMPGAYLRCTWIGPGRGHIDPEKEGKADALKLAAGTTTMERVAAEAGMTFEELVEQRAREAALLEEYGLVSAAEVGAAAAAAPQHNAPET